MTAVTIGKFDGFHKGHRLLLSRLKELSDQGMKTAVIRIGFPGQRILSQEEDLELLQEYGSPELITLSFTEELAAKTPEAFIRDILERFPDLSAIIVGIDFHFGVGRSGNIDTLSRLGVKYGFRLMAVEKLKIGDAVVSSSWIRELLHRGEICFAEDLLGHPIQLTGEVRHGKALGRTLGFPTINLIPPEDKMLPCNGVYRSEVFLPEEPDRIYTGLTNIGLRPTVEESEQVTMETFIKDYSGDLYGQVVTVHPCEFIRPEMHFSSVEELVTQMKKDLKSL